MVLRLREFDSGEGNTLGYNNQFTLTFNNITDRYELVHNASGGVAGSFDTSEKDKAISFIEKSISILKNLFPDGHPDLENTFRIKEEILKNLGKS